MGSNLEKQKSEYFEYFKEIKSNQIEVFENINNKSDLFRLFVTVNNTSFQKPYFDLTFLEFLKTNDGLINQYFGETKYNEILEKNECNEDNKNELFNIISKDSNDVKKVCTIIISFYYLLFYKFNDIKVIKGRTNIGNVYINMILKTFVKFLNIKYNNLNTDFINVLNELYYFDIINSDYKDNDKVIESYDFSEVEKLMSTCGSNLKAKFELDKMEYKKELKKHLELFEALAYRIHEDSIFYDFYLKRIGKHVYSNTITIIIDILHREDNENEWKNFMKYFEKESMFYFYKWSCCNKKHLLKEDDDKKLDDYKSLTKICGILLANILLSNKLFNNFQLNIVGFNIGANVVKYCIKELAKINGKKNYVKFKNVLLIGGATHIKHEDKWKEIITNNVIDKFINCYSGVDEKLKSFYPKCFKDANKSKSSIGSTSFELKDNKDNNLIINVDFTQDKYDQLSYDFGKVAEKLKLIV